MLGLRRASRTLKSRTFLLAASRPSSSKPSRFLNAGISLSDLKLVDEQKPTQNKHTRLLEQWHMFSSHIGMKNKGEDDDGDDDDDEDTFSELEDASPVSIDRSKEDLVSGPEALGEEDEDDDDDDDDGEEGENDMHQADVDMDEDLEKSKSRRGPSKLFKEIVAAPGTAVNSVLAKWISDGNVLGRCEIYSAMLDLRRRRMFGRALQFYEWLEMTKNLEFVERDYSSCLDLIAKVRGLHRAEAYISKIPESERGEMVFRTLLANSVLSNNVKKSEGIFNSMKDKNFPVTAFTCNQLILLYKRTDKKKIADVLLLMEKEDVKPTSFTYRILIDAKGQSNDISGMEQILETMKSQGIKRDVVTLAVMARHYIRGGLREKAEPVLEEMEAIGTKWANRRLMTLYAELGMEEEVHSLWEACERSPRLSDCMSAIEAFGKLDDVGRAEAVFEMMKGTWTRLAARHYSTLLRVYTHHKMLEKGKELVKSMAESGCRVGPLTWDSIVKLHVDSGDVEKADHILLKASQQAQFRPMFSSFMAIMAQYAEKGDVRNTEKIFHRMRQYGYVARVTQFQTLIRAYIVAKLPAYGIRERMMADNVYPNKSLAASIARVECFRRSSLTDLLD